MNVERMREQHTQTTGGKGMPHSGGSGHGDEYVRVIARLAQHLSDRELFRELAELRPD